MRQISLFLTHYIKIIITIGLLPLLICACGFNKNQYNKEKDYIEIGDMTIKDIVYGKKTDNNYTVYIEENGSFEPYLVIDDKYNSGILLLRKYLLEVQISFNNQTSFGARSGYYPSSNIDIYLSTEYSTTLSTSMQEKILDTSISVSTLETISSGGSVRTTEEIQRKIFLLSATELNIKSSMTAVENKPLKYFKDAENLIATYKDGEADAYWLRSAYLWDDHQAWAIGSDGLVGGSLVSFTYALRPAFCLSKDTPISKENLDGEVIYVITK